mmetsp:Transcript_24100/g.66597  ORF Transcript_24100/g.66597 Transcript_24100/m.66597 type:complete len:103 (+) Transcript_24100:106-414(+)
MVPNERKTQAASAPSTVDGRSRGSTINVSANAVHLLLKTSSVSLHTSVASHGHKGQGMRHDDSATIYYRIGCRASASSTYPLDAQQHYAKKHKIAQFVIART